MRNTLSYLVLPLLLFLPLISVLAEEPVSRSKLPLPAEALNAQELMALFNDRTVHSVTAVQGRKSVSYYDPSGEIRQVRNGTKRIGRWRVTEQNRICLQMEDLPEKCRIIVKEDGVYKKYILRKNGRHQHSVSYPLFLEGNVLNH